VHPKPEALPLGWVVVAIQAGHRNADASVRGRELVQNLTNEPIYEREVVKRGGADFVERGSRTSPSPSASVDLAQFGPGHGRSVRATRYTSSESEAERDCSLSIPAMFESWTDVT
jgi:hypothetical protein